MTLVAVRRGNGSVLGAAATYVTNNVPGAKVLAVWPARQRDRHGNPGYMVEYEPPGPLTGTCVRCGAHITLIHLSGNSHKWVTDPNRKETWHCGNDPKYPVRTHSPQEVGA